MTAEAALEHALEKGIALLLTKVAEKLEAAAAPSPAPRDTELNRFIAQKKGGPVRVAPGASAPRTRVEGGVAGDAEADVVEVPRDRRTKRERGA